MANGKAPLNRAILSLLVAIIGQAHLLYYARFSAELEREAMTAFAQLKRDADDLFEAIAEVQAALGEEDRT